MDLKIKTETMETDFNPWTVDSLEDFRVYSCPECGSLFSNREQFVGHVMVSHPKARDTLLEILQVQGIGPEISHEEKSPTLAKPSVNQDFHEVEHESEECVEVYKCDLCTTFFNSEAELMIHKEKGHRCEFCTVTYFTVQEKLHHMSGSHNFQCDQCCQIFPFEIELKYHECQIRKMENGHGKGKKAAFKINIDCSHPVESGIMNCGDFETYLNEWIRIFKGKDVTLGNGRDKNKIILTSAEPSWRLRVVPGQKDSYEFRYFQVNNNGDDVTHQCELCPSFFNSTTGLKNHMSHCHSFQCHQCRQIFRLKKDLKYHESQTHPICNTCGKSSLTKEGGEHHEWRCYLLNGNVKKKKKPNPKQSKSRK